MFSRHRSNIRTSRYVWKSCLIFRTVLKCGSDSTIAVRQGQINGLPKLGGTSRNVELEDEE